METQDQVLFDSVQTAQNHGMGDKIIGFLDGLTRRLSVLSSVLTILMALYIMVGVSCRLFWGYSFQGSLEIQQYALATIVFLALPYSIRQKAQVSIDLIFTSFSPKTKAVFESIFYLLSACLYFVICWQNIVRGVIAIQDNEIGVATGLPICIFVFITAFGAGLVTILLIIDSIKSQVDVARRWSNPKLWLSIIYLTSALLMASPYILGLFTTGWPPVMVGLIGLGLAVAIMVLGMQIAFALGLIGFLGLWLLNGSSTALQVIRMSTFESVANYFFCVIPFFVLMGFTCFRSGMSDALYNAGHKMFGQLPGGLAIGTVFGCAGFAAICGDSMATAGTMGSVAIPEMKKYKYNPLLSTGCVAAGGTLGILIPPSMGFIIYGLITEQSIGKLFMAGILPGSLLTIVFAAIILLRCKIDPTLGPKSEKVSWAVKMKAMGQTWPILLLFLIVIGGIYSGITTPTEAGGVGLVVALGLGLLKRTLNRESLFAAFYESMSLVSVIFAILIGVTFLGYFVTISEIPMMLSDFIVGLHLSRWLVFVAIMFVYLILGMVMNIIPMIMITLPILFPTVAALGFDPIWFGVVMVIMMEMGQITPPMGVNVFVISGVAKDVPMTTIFRGVAPFALGMVLVIIILCFFPDIALYLPGTMETLGSLSQ